MPNQELKISPPVSENHHKVDEDQERHQTDLNYALYAVRSLVILVAPPHISLETVILTVYDPTSLDLLPIKTPDVDV